jgi:thiaminase/transcriptional activator TenA
VLGDRFTGALWGSVGDVFEAIISHPFILGLTEGSLSLNVFREYAIQDAHYLSLFLRALVVAGSKAPDDYSALLLFSAARDSLLVERTSLHNFLMKEWGIESASFGRREMSPVNRAYTDFLIATAYEEPFLVGLFAVLPCFWVYLEAGKELLKRRSPNPTYRRWIKTYSSPSYEELVRRVLEAADDAAEDASARERRWGEGVRWSEDTRRLPDGSPG